MKQCVITSATRTAVGAYLGGLRTLRAMDLGSVVIKEVAGRSHIETSLLDHVVMGEVMGLGNVARASALLAGVPVEVPGYTVDRQCGSSLQAVLNAVQEIQTDSSDVVLAGGTESMSRMPYYLPFASRYEGLRGGNAELIDSFLYSASKAVQPPELYHNLNMGITAENVAKQFGISRERQDEYALDSQQKTKAAMEQGKFKAEIVPVEVKGKKETVVFDTDEHPRPQATMESLAKLRPSFLKEGTVTAGNSSGMNDGASAVVVMGTDKAAELGCVPMVKIASAACAGVDPSVMGLGPVPAIKKALAKANLSLEDIDLYEINEAFAAQTLGVLTELNMLPGTAMYQRVNVNGGAIAHGHALGNSGTRLLTTLIYEMKRRNVQYGVVSLCIGGGQGIAMVFENCM